MSYQVLWSEISVKKLNKLEKSIASRIIKRIESIQQDPFRFVKRLEKLPFFSLRVGAYRVIMRIERNNLVIFVVTLGKRSGVYEAL